MINIKGPIRILNVIVPRLKVAMKELENSEG